MLIGYSQTRFSPLMQIADVTAVYGVSFVVISSNTALAWFWLHKNARFRHLWPAAAAGLLLGVALIYGNIAVARWGNITADKTVAMLQQNISIDETDGITEAKFRDGYVQMADQLQADAVDMLILPESPSPLSFQYDADYRRVIQQLARRVYHCQLAARAKAWVNPQGGVPGQRWLRQQGAQVSGKHLDFEND